MLDCSIPVYQNALQPLWRCACKSKRVCQSIQLSASNLYCVLGGCVHFLFCIHLSSPIKLVHTEFVWGWLIAHIEILRYISWVTEFNQYLYYCVIMQIGIPFRLVSINLSPLTRNAKQFQNTELTGKYRIECPIFISIRCFNCYSLFFSFNR